MNKKLIGRFYFKKTKNGNLIGEFSNNLSKTNSTESADLIKQDTIGFNGEYASSWREDAEVKFAKLSITDKAGCKNIYTIKWEQGDIIIFWGEGFVCDDILIGDYRDFENID